MNQGSAGARLNLRLSVGIRSAPQGFFLRPRLKWLQLPVACYSSGDEGAQEVGAEACTSSWGLGSEPALSPLPTFHWPKEVTWLSPTLVRCENMICLLWEVLQISMAKNVDVPLYYRRQWKTGNNRILITTSRIRLLHIVENQGLHQQMTWVSYIWEFVIIHNTTYWNPQKLSGLLASEWLITGLNPRLSLSLSPELVLNCCLMGLHVSEFMNWA